MAPKPRLLCMWRKLRRRQGCDRQHSPLDRTGVRDFVRSQTEMNDYERTVSDRAL
jgi:hypothetical protein